MASAIISETIDENFPVAGQDNDSQGFRDNFNIIKTALSVASTEITDLQQGVARKDGDNNFDGNEISRANFVANTLKTNLSLASGTGLASDDNVSFLEGAVHVIKVRLNVTLFLQDLPTTEYAAMRFILTGDNNPRTITFERTGGGATVITDGSPVFTGDAVSVNSSTQPVVIDMFTYNAGSTVFLKHVGTFS